MSIPRGTDYADKHPAGHLVDEPATEHLATLNDEQVRKMSVIPGFAEVTDNAVNATITEKNMSIREGIRLYPKAIGWSILISTTIIMEGYDVVLLGSFFAFPEFQRQFGQPVGDGTYQVPASWQAGLSNGANCGEILGLFATGIIADRFGYRKTLGGALVAVTCFIFLSFFAVNVHMLLAAEILCGIPWGVFQTLTCQYASEVMPVALRCYLTTYVNLCWVIGQLLASGVLRALLNNDTEWGWRIPFALQWIWPVPIIIGIIFAPESPWWLVRKGRIQDAEHSVTRLTSQKANPEFNVQDTVAMMIHTNEVEKDISAGTSYWDCFKGIDLRRTEIVVGVWAIQNLCGSSFMGYSTYFYEQAGLSKESSFNFSMGQYALGAIGTVSSWWLMSRLGRRTLYVLGLVVLDALLLIIGFCGLGNATHTSLGFVIGSMLLVYVFVYDLTVGPVCYSLVSELSSTRLRTKTIVIARNVYNVVGIVNNVITPFMLNPTAWNWGAKSGFFWFAVCFLCLVWTYFRLPEPKGRTYGELDVLFENGVSARKFAATQVSQFQGESVRMASVSESVMKANYGGTEHEHKETAV